MSCKRSRRLQKSFHRVHTAEPLLDGNAGRVGKKRLNNDLVCNLWNVLQSAQIFTFSETNIRVFSSSSIFQHFHVHSGCVSSDFGGICGCCLLSTGGFGGRSSSLEEVILRKF